MSTSATQSGVYTDGVVRQFAFMTVVWGVVGMLVGVFIAAELAWPELNMGIPWLSYGRLRPLHTNAVIFAFGGSALTDAAFQLHERDGTAWRIELPPPPGGMVTARLYRPAERAGAFFARELVERLGTRRQVREPARARRRRQLAGRSPRARRAVADGGSPNRRR